MKFIDENTPAATYEIERPDFLNQLRDPSQQAQNQIVSSSNKIEVEGSIPNTRAGAGAESNADAVSSWSKQQSNQKSNFEN